MQQGSLEPHRILPSYELLRMWVPSREKLTLVTPCACARSYLRKHCPVRTFQTCVMTGVSPEGSVRSGPVSSWHRSPLGAPTIHSPPPLGLGFDRLKGELHTSRSLSSGGPRSASVRRQERAP